MSKLSFWKWLYSRVKEWFKTPYTLGITLFSIAIGLAIHDTFLYFAKEPRPILWGKGIWAITVYSIIALPSLIIGIFLILYGYYAEFVRK